MDSLFHVAVGSSDATKVAAVRKAFFSAFPTQTAIISRHDEATGPPPAAWAAKGLSGDAMRRVGAVKAAYAALSANPIASYGVGLVPGVADTAGDGAERIGSVVVVSRDGRESHARTASVPLPPRVARLLRGQEPGHGALGLEAAVDVAMKDSERSGVVAKLTRGLLSAESYWEQAVICCLTTFLHDESGLYKTLPQSSAALVRDRETRDAAAAAGPAATDDGDDSDGFEMLGTSTLAQREAEARDRAIRGEGEVISVDDDGDDDAVKSQKLRSALKLLAHATAPRPRGVRRDAAVRAPPRRVRRDDGAERRRTVQKSRKSVAIAPSGGQFRGTARAAVGVWSVSPFSGRWTSGARRS